MDFATFILAALGVACIYAGYRLFCGLPALNHGRAAVFLMNVVPGALLAFAGMFLLTTQARAMVSHRPASIQRHQPPAAEGTSWGTSEHPGSPRAVDHSA